MNDEYVSIFMETSEDLGILYRSYKPVLTHLNHFISTIEKCVKMLNDDPDHVDIDLGAAIKKFKADIDFEKSPDPIKTGSINDTTKKLKEFKNDLEKSLSRYIKLKSSTKYGGTALSAIVTRPRVYSKDIDEEKYDKINKNIRNVNRALDWIEKCIIDLYNFVDQDLNLLNIVNRVYVKNKIYENALPGGVEEDVATSVIGMLPNATGEAVGVKGVLNTRDKRTGTAPGYIANNHDMAKYGEEDGEEKKDDDNKEVTLDDYKRPSAEEDKKDEPVEFDPNLVQDGGSEPSPFNDTKDDNSSNNSRSSSGVNNYYYYTYNNSLNRHSHSNIDKSVHDDHSDHSYHDDHSSRKYVTDHSVKNEIKDDKTDAIYPFDEFGKVKDIYLVRFGNGGYRTVIALMEDGTLSALSAKELIEDHIAVVMPNVSGRDNYVSVEEIKDEDEESFRVIGKTDDGEEIELDFSLNF